MTGTALNESILAFCSFVRSASPLALPLDENTIHIVLPLDHTGAKLIPNPAPTVLVPHAEVIPCPKFPHPPILFGAVGVKYPIVDQGPHGLGAS